MRNGSLARVNYPPVLSSPDEGFALDDLRVFASVPPDHDAIALRSAVVIYDTRIYREDVVAGAFYVVEKQRTVSNMPWENWLRLEVQANFLSPLQQPQSPLKISREVVQVVRWPCGDDLWGYRLVGGFCDGPLEMWGARHGMIGKVVGLYRPN